MLAVITRAFARARVSDVRKENGDEPDPASAVVERAPVLKDVSAVALAQFGMVTGDCDVVDDDVTVTVPAENGTGCADRETGPRIRSPADHQMGPHSWFCGFARSRDGLRSGRGRLG